MKKLLPCLLAFFPVWKAQAQQCPAILNCPQGTQLICDLSANDSSFWNAPPYTWSQTLNSADVYEGSVDLNLKVLGCSGGGPVSISYTLYFDLDNDNLEETIVLSSALPPAGKVLANNAFNPGYTGGDTVLFDCRATGDSLRFRFGLKLTTLGDTTYARMGWHTMANPDAFIAARLPEGKHRILWTATQDGVVRACQFAFRVKDCLKPMLNCKIGVNIALDPSGTGALGYNDLLESAEDNITPANLLQFAVRKAGAGMGFPLDINGNPVLQQFYNCTDLGPKVAELWVRDRAGNIESCIANITVSGDLIACPDTHPTLCAYTFWDGALIEQVQYDLVWNNSDSTSASTHLPGLSGCTLLDSLPPAPLFTIVPKKDMNPLNGITTYDLVLISRHILSIQLFDQPWKLLAADVNKNGSVTTIDIVELRKLLLGLYQKLPFNTSWRFFSTAACQFSSNPFTGWCPPGLTLQTLPYSSYLPEYTFKGLKVGDVNATADPDSLAAQADDRSPLALVLQDRLLLPGEVADIPVRLPELSAWSGFQLAIQSDEQQLVLEQVIPGDLPDMDANAFALTHSGLNVSWFQAEPQWLVAGERLFTLRVRALAPVQLRNALRLVPERLSPEAYPAGDDIRSLELVFETMDAGSNSAIFPAQPNPTSGGTIIPLRLREASSVTLELVDLTGKRLYMVEQVQPSGGSVLEIPASAFPQAGLYYWQVQIGSELRGGKLIRM